MKRGSCVVFIEFLPVDTLLQRLELSPSSETESISNILQRQETVRTPIPN